MEEVLIVGAGPTGLALAIWLKTQGIGVRIIDSTTGPGTTSRALAVQARTLELYRQAGIAEPVVAAGHKNPGLNLWFRGKRRAHLPLADVGQDLTPYPYLLIFPQDRHEELLIAKLAALGVTVERQTTFVDYEDKTDHITARLRRPDGFMQSCDALYLAGCDGARSLIRHQSGSSFPGGTYEKIFYVADVQIEGILADGQTHIALETADFLAFLAYDDAGRGRLIGTVEATEDEHAAKMTFADVSQNAIQRLGLTIKTVNWFSTYRVHHRVTDHYRHGRVFLLGDAAHIHSPAGGQGMNTGIGDAINLAWKLAAVIGTRAPENLLDSYGEERRAFACQLVATTDRLFTFVTASGAFARLVRSYIAPYLISAVYRLRAVRKFAFRIISQTMITYRACGLNEGVAGRVAGGDRLPWVRLAGADNYTSLNTMGWQVHVYGMAQDTLVQWCGARHLALHVFAWDDAYETAGLARNALYLLRPDSYVAFAEATGTVAAMDAYLARHGLQLG